MHGISQNERRASIRASAAGDGSVCVLLDGLTMPTQPDHQW